MKVYRVSIQNEYGAFVSDTSFASRKEARGYQAAIMEWAASVGKRVFVVLREGAILTEEAPSVLV